MQEIITFIIPSFFGFGGKLYWGGMPFTDYPNYIGLLLIIFALIGFIKSTINKQIKIFILFVIIFSFALSLGNNFILFYDNFNNSYNSYIGGDLNNYFYNKYSVHSFIFKTPNNLSLPTLIQ